DIVTKERKKSPAIYDLNDKILAIKVNSFDKDNTTTNDKFIISEDTESETILKFSYAFNKIDPDIVLTSGGDQFLFPHLFYRAKINKIEAQLSVNLNRELDQRWTSKRNRQSLRKDHGPFPSFPHPSLSSSSYISYGKVYFRPRPFFLYGRIHIDKNSSFLYKDNGLDGLSEISRICRIPLQIASRSTIGKCLSSLYFYNAYKRNVLIPWKPTASETFKSFSDLIKVDKGGFVFESRPGKYDKVAEFDFVSLYPNIMLKKNVSSETINCDCCKSEPDNRIPDLEHLYHVCKRRVGIVPLSLKIVLDRRLEYKKRKKEFAKYRDNNIINRCDSRQAALKWILVTSFGYLGFSNSKFGRIDAHIAVCAFARDILLKTSKIAESNGFEVVHGIVDSIWVKRIKNTQTDDGKNKNIYKKLKKEIEKQTGFPVSFEGMYKWIVFDSSKTNSRLPALNRYFGVFEDSSIRIRGIETRRHDTPPLFARFQTELLQNMSKYNSVREVGQSLHDLKDIHKKYNDLIASGKACFLDLVFTKRISRNSDKYNCKKTVESCVVKILLNHGKLLQAGEEIRYIITNFYSKSHLERALPVELFVNHETSYDSKRYCELLNDVYQSTINQFSHFR
ncbi:MAG: hypothetical protein M3162_09305, partial [Thermoproteota archaeon]|nr:hypothetical protein [Thermoproteota archaeon]